MPYARISISHPRHGQEAMLEQLTVKLAREVGALPGCLQSLALRANDGSGDFARFTLYEDQTAADVTANNATIMALRSEIHLAVEAGHTERSFTTI
jgi:quinol monooxygenase YgiN